MKNKSLFELATRLNEITSEVKKLEMEYIKIADEIISRIPELKGNKDLRLYLIKELKNGR